MLCLEMGVLGGASTLFDWPHMCRTHLSSPGLSSTQDTWPNVQLLPHAHFLNARHTTNNLREHLASFDRRLQPEGAELLAKARGVG